jgi:hypothetical protein
MIVSEKINKSLLIWNVFLLIIFLFAQEQDSFNILNYQDAVGCSKRKENLKKYLNF